MIQVSEYFNDRFGRILLILIITLLCWTPKTNSQDHIFLENEIKNSISRREDFYSKIKTDRNSVIVNKNFEDIQILVEENLRGLDQNKYQPWIEFFKGIASLNQKETAGNHFLNAVSQRDASAGDLWLLANEFLLIDQDEWVDKALERLQKKLYLAGTTNSKLLGIQLFILSEESMRNNKDKRAEMLNKWSETFAYSKTWHQINFQKHKIVTSPGEFIQKTGGFISSILNHWPAQLITMLQTYRWIRVILFLFAAVSILALSSKHLTDTMHKISDLLPVYIPLPLRNLFIFILFFSISFISFIPVLLIAAALVWSKVDKKKRLFLGISAAVLCLSPLDIYVFSEMTRMSTEDSPLILFKKARTQQWDYPLEKRILQKLKEDKSNTQLNLAAAILYCKKNQYTKSQNHLEKAYRTAPKDPTVLITRANIDFLNNNYSKAKKYYKEAERVSPENPYLCFNYGQLLLQVLETGNGKKLLSKATRMEPDLINSFIHFNTTHYPGNWPRFRRVIFPDYSTFYFWSHVFPRQFQGINRANIYGRTQFSGLNLIQALTLFPLLFLILISTVKNKRKRTSVKRHFTCRYCHRKICKKCRVGALCFDCYTATEGVNHEKIANRIIEKVRRRKRNIEVVLQSLFNIFFPGSGNLLKQDFHFAKTFTLICLSAAAYSTYINLPSLSIPYPVEIINSMAIFIMSVFIIYNLIFVFKGSKYLFQNFEKEKNNGS